MNGLLKEAKTRKFVISIVLRNGRVIVGSVVSVTDDCFVVHTHKTTPEMTYQYSTARIDEIICIDHNLGADY